MKVVAFLTVLACLSAGCPRAHCERGTDKQVDVSPRVELVQKKTDVDPWASAEAAFAKHIAPLVKRIRSKCDDPRAQYAEFRSNLLKKYLPNHRVYAQDCKEHLISTTSVFILDRRGTIVALGNVDGTWEEGAKASPVQGITDVVKSQGVKIENADRAVEVAKLIEEVRSASSYVCMLRINTKNYTVFDRDKICFLATSGYAGPHWAYSATKKDGGWIVKVRYAGPPASIIAPPTYEISVNEQQLFRDIRIRQ